jgi:hypothetical protein
MKRINTREEMIAFYVSANMDCSDINVERDVARRAYAHTRLSMISVLYPWS